MSLEGLPDRGNLSCKVIAKHKDACRFLVYSDVKFGRFEAFFGKLLIL